ncbi:MAG: glycolate oxidase subunit GlcF [Magnetovibrio sp.]|nr:glycolate oxidase subunit GlcF [Magnetovibrio sp.]
METRFTNQQLHQAPIKMANDILRNCVHCGFCTATCPTYVVLGDELDSPRGRIYQIRDMLEKVQPAPANTVRHIDRCLSCLSCMTTCPSGVDYMHLVDHARNYIEETHKRPLGERILRNILAIVLPRPGLFRLSLISARLIKPLRTLLPGRLKGMVALAPDSLPKAEPIGTQSPQGDVRMRVAFLPGCAQQVLAPRINAAAARLLVRLGCEVIEPDDLQCCGALTHHMGKEDAALELAKYNIEAWERANADVIAITASGCSSMVKDYGHMLKDDHAWAERAAEISAKTRDISEVVSELGLEGVEDFDKPSVAYHAPCSLQHGQKNIDGPPNLLKAAGFEVNTPKEAHLCCGSAGIYNIMQPELGADLGKRKGDSLDVLKADVIATGNIGCLVQIGEYAGTPVVHSVELLDWATGGPSPLK